MTPVACPWHDQRGADCAPTRAAPSPVRTLARQLDLKMPFVPNHVVDFIMKHMAVQFIPFMNKQAGKFEPGGKLHHYLDDHKDVYNEMHRRLGAMEVKVLSA